MYEQPSGVVTAAGSPASWFYGNTLVLVSNGPTTVNQFQGWTTPASPVNCWSAEQVVNLSQPLTVAVLEVFVGGAADGLGFSAQMTVSGMTFATSYTATDTWELYAGYENPSTPNPAYCYITQAPSSTSVVKLVLLPPAPQVYASTFAAFNLWMHGVLCLCGVVTYPTYDEAFVPSAAGVTQLVASNYPVLSYEATAYATADAPGSDWSVDTPVADPVTSAWLESQLGDKLTTGFTYTVPFAGSMLGFGIYLGVGELPDDLYVFTTQLTITVGGSVVDALWTSTTIVNSPYGTDWTITPAADSTASLRIRLNTREPTLLLYVSGIVKLTIPPLVSVVFQVSDGGPILMQAAKVTSDPTSAAGPSFAPTVLEPPFDVVVTDVTCNDFEVLWDVDPVTAAQVVSWSLQSILGDTTPFLTVDGSARQANVSRRPSMWRPADPCSPKPQYIIYGTTFDGLRTPASNPSVFVPCASPTSCLYVTAARRTGRSYGAHATTKTQ